MSKDKSGKSLEQAVARLQQMFDAGSTVTHDEDITDRLGISRQFDVVIRGGAAGRNYLGVIECKDWSDRVGTPEVEAFVMKARNVNANFILMVSYKGFSKPALVMAKHEGVGTLSLLPEDPLDAGFKLGVRVYAKYYRWHSLEMVLHYPSEDGPITNFSLANVLLDGKPVIHWFEKQLGTTYANLLTEGVLPIEMRFREPQQLEIDGTKRTILGITVRATRQYQKKMRFVQLQGDAFYDWNTSLAQIPAGGSVTTELFTFDFSTWIDYDGDIDEELKQGKQFFTFCFFITELQFEDIGEIVDLTAYC
jgi:hypothetical protein